MDQLSFDAAGIDRQATAARNLAADLRSIHGTWAKATQSSGTALGLGELISAFTTMRQAWDAEFDVYIDVVSTLSDNLHTSAANYIAAEKANTASAHGVGG